MKTTKRTINRTLAVLLAFVMMISIFPVYASAASSPSIPNISIGTRPYGDSFNITGKISSTTKISWVRGQFIKADGTAAGTPVYDYPNATYLVLGTSNINAKLKFGTLAPGSYKLRIAAKNSSGTTTREFSFTISSAPNVKPNTFTTVTYGRSKDISGTIKSYTMITKVQGYIKDSNGSLAQPVVTIYPYVTTLNLATSNINYNLKFGNLPKGKYTLYITATNAAGKSATKSFTFTVK